MKSKYYKNSGLTTTHNRVDCTQNLIKVFAKQTEKETTNHSNA
jgi:hypothetical protein